MRRIARRLAVLFAAALVMGCSPETSTPPPADAAGADLGPTPAPTKRRVGAPIKKNKPVPAGIPRASSVKPNPNL
jgi:hypothetical protein